MEHCDNVRDPRLTEIEDAINLARHWGVEAELVRDALDRIRTNPHMPIGQAMRMDMAKYGNRFEPNHAALAQ